MTDCHSLTRCLGQRLAGTGLALLLGTLLWCQPAAAFTLASGNIPLDSPLYGYLDKLAGFGLITSNIAGLKPYARAEAARLVLEAEENLASRDGAAPSLALDMLKRCRELLPRELSLYRTPEAAPLLDGNPLTSARLRYVYVDGLPRNFERDAILKGGGKAFGFIGGNLRPLGDAIIHKSGSEGTPLLENNEGVIYRDGNNAEFRWEMDGFLSRWAVLVIEPIATTIAGEGEHSRSNKLALQKGYVKLGSGGLELEAGRDANWFGPGFRGALTLTNNAQNFDQVKLSSPEPLDVGWVRQYLGLVKYSFIGARFNETGSGADRRQPYFIGAKVAVKPTTWFEIGGNFVRQEGGPGFSGDTTLRDSIFGGGDTNKSNSIAGFDLRFRIPWLRNTELYGEYAGEDSASFWPFLESYVAGIYIPNLTADGRNDLRFEYFWGHAYLYSDGKFPTGYTYYGMSPGHSQGGASQEFFVRYSHWFSPRHTAALEYFFTDRGRVGKINGQVTEYKNAARAFWNLPLVKDLDLGFMYGWERIDNLDLEAGAHRVNQLFKMDLSYRY
ncbi:MAG TPA: capsule assembly Wzi family protein [Geobacteraceae bacterium]